MTVRPGMWHLIDELRGMTNAGEEDYTIGAVTYWSAEQLQDILDRRRLEVVREQLVHVDEVTTGNALSVTRYYSRRGNYEGTTGGTAVFVVRDGTGTIAGTATYSVDYNRGEVIFSSNTGGSVYYLTGRSYDLNSAAADVWDRKAAQIAGGAYSWSSDNMSVNKTGLRVEAVNMARYYRGLAGPSSIDMFRGDTDVID